MGVFLIDPRPPGGRGIEIALDMPIQIDYSGDMNTTDRVEKVIRQWQQGFLTLPDLVEQLSYIDLMSTVDRWHTPTIFTPYPKQASVNA